MLGSRGCYYCGVVIRAKPSKETGDAARMALRCMPSSANGRVLGGWSTLFTIINGEGGTYVVKIAYFLIDRPEIQELSAYFVAAHSGKVDNTSLRRYGQD